MSTINIRDIAKLAGVSTATVSRAINNPDAVQKETRSRIDSVLKETGYVPPSVKKNAMTGVILFFFNEDDYLFYDRIYIGFDSIVRNTPYTIVMCPIPANETARKKILLSFSRRKIDGVIYALRDYYQADISWFLSRKIPVILARKYSDMSLALPRCYIDFSVGSFRMTEHLLSIGCRKIYLMVEQVSAQFLTSFCSGWKRAFFEQNLPFSEDWIIDTKNSVQGGYEKAMELLTSSDIPDAFFCSSNEMALGILRAARDLSISVPDRLSVVGFTDSPTAAFTEPELTTLNQPIDQLGVMTAEIMLNALERKGDLSLVPPEIVLQPQLCIRKSCRI